MLIACRSSTLGFDTHLWDLHLIINLNLLQDKAQPETQARSFGSLAFEAYLAVDDPAALALVRQPGSDGFRMASSALFQVRRSTPTHHPHSPPPLNK